MAIRIPIITDFDRKGLSAANKALDDFAKGAQVALGAIAVGTVAFGVKSVSEFAKFDDKMTQSLAIMGNVSEEMRKQMETTARDVAKSTTFSAEQAAESYYFLASAGLDAAASIASMPQVASFAQAGMFDMARATDLLTDAQSALGLTIRDDANANMLNMSRVSDVLVKANTLANASVEQFSIALTTKAGPAMRAVGMDVEEGVAVLAAFADQGVKGEEAGTNFAIALRDLQTKAIDNKKAFAEAGVAVFDARGEMRNMADIVADLEKATAGMSDEQKKATFATLGLTDKSMGAIAALLGTSDAIRTYEEGLRSAGGVTQEVADKQLTSFSSQLKLLMSAVEDVFISIGQELAPAIGDLIPKIRELLPEIGEKLVTAIKKIDFAKIVQDFGNFVVLIVENLDKIGQLIQTITLIAGAVVVYTTATKLAAAAQAIFNSTLLLNPWGLAAVALAGIAIGMTQVYDAAKKAAPEVEAVRMEIVKTEDAFTTAATNGSSAYKGLIPSLTYTGGALGAVATEAKNAEVALGGLETQALDTAVALVSIPASPTSSTNLKPLNPKPGEVYTWYSLDENGVAIWKQQTWTGTEWTKPKVMTYDPPKTGGSTGKSKAQTLADNRAKLLSDIKGYNQEVMKLSRLGENAMSQYETSVVTTFEKVRSTIAEGVDMGVFTERGGRALNKLADVTEKALTKIARLRQGLAAQYDELTKKLADAKALREGTRDQILALADLNELSKSVTSTVDATGKTIESTSYSSATLIANLRGVVEGVKTFKENMAKLRELGLDPRLYQQIIESGMMAGGATAKAIIDGGPEAVTEINKLFGQLETVGSDLGLALSEVMYNGGEASIQSLIDGVIAMDDKLATQAELVADTFFGAFQAKVDDSTFDTQPFLDKLRDMSTEINGIADILGSDFRDAFLAAVGDLTTSVPKAPLANLPTKQQLTNLLPPVTVLTESGQAMTAVFDELGNLIRSYTGSAGDIGSSGLVNQNYFQDYVPIPGTKGNQTTINLTVNANDRIGGVKAGELAVEYISKYVDANGSVIKVFGG